MDSISYSGLGVLAILICFTGLNVRITSGICSTIANCDVCTDPNICTSCSSTYGLTSSQPPTCQLCSTNSGCTLCTKMSLCDVCTSINTGPDTTGTGTCSACAANCRICAINGAGKCDTGQCMTGYGLNIGNTCSECPTPHCISCSRKSSALLNSPLTCDTCNSTYFMNPNNHICQPCSDVNCQICYYNNPFTPDQDFCSTCNVGFYRNSSSTDGAHVCIPCSVTNCLYCSSPAACSSCNAGYYVNSTSTPGTNVCLRCASNCNTCFGPASYQCYDCIPGFGFVMGISFCAPCTIKFCTTCRTYYNTSCTNCLTGYNLDSPIKCSPSSGDAALSGSQQTSVVNNVTALIVAIVFAVISGLTLIALIVVIAKLCEHRNKSCQQGQHTQETSNHHNNYSTTNDGTNHEVGPHQLSPKSEYQALDYSRNGKENSHNDDVNIPVVYDDLELKNFRNKRT